MWNGVDGEERHSRGWGMIWDKVLNRTGVIGQYPQG